MKWPSFRRKKVDDEWVMPPPQPELEVGEWEGGVYTTATPSEIPLHSWWSDYEEESNDQ